MQHHAIRNKGDHCSDKIVLRGIWYKWKRAIIHLLSVTLALFYLSLPLLCHKYSDFGIGGYIIAPSHHFLHSCKYWSTVAVVSYKTRFNNYIYIILYIYIYGHNKINLYIRNKWKYVMYFCACGMKFFEKVENLMLLVTINIKKILIYSEICLG